MRAGPLLVAAACACATVSACADATRPAATELRIDPADTTVVAGARYPLRIIVRNDGAPVDVPIDEGRFLSSDTAVAVVTRFGVVTTDHFGESRIRATLRTRDGSLDATAIVRVGAIAN